MDLVTLLTTLKKRIITSKDFQGNEITIENEAITPMIRYRDTPLLSRLQKEENYTPFQITK